MTFNTKDLRDGHLPLVERIDIALRRVTNGEGQMRVPVEATDPDIVLHNCRDRIVELEGLLREHEGVTRDAVAVTLAGNALAGELAKALAEVDGLRLELTVKDARIDVLTLDRRDTAKARDEARAQLAEARAQIARLTPLTEIHDAWRKLHGGEESPSEESVVRFIEFAHAAAGRAYEVNRG